jgi:hypothetical protein
MGHAMPWQGYSVEALALLRPDLAVGVYGGGGGFHTSGIQNEKSYDLAMETHGAGVAGRFWFERLEKLSLAAAAGYTTWSGSISPHGSEEPDVDPQDKLSAAFRASGLVAGLSAGLTWIWDSGLFLQWTPVGIEMSRALSKDYSRDSTIVRDAVTSNLQRTGFYGLIDLEFGYFF